MRELHFMHSLYPALEPFSQQHLRVSSVHQVYVEQCGNPQGIPVLFLHGGPGSGCNERHRRFFDPYIYHIILFDQRGCGRSRPQGETANNTTFDLVSDMEMIRLELGVKQWLICGGSWGATLGVVYAQQHPKQVSGMILRGIFLGRQQDIDWVYRDNGAAKMFPQLWNELVAELPSSQRAMPLITIYQWLIGNDLQKKHNIYHKLQQWEAALLNIEYQRSSEINANPAIIQLYYSLNHCFIDAQPILDQIDVIRHIPTEIIQGRDDLVCPLAQARQLSQQWSQVNLNIVDKAGHLASDPLIMNALISATINFSKAQ